jgi:hypothetical protein
MLYNKLKQMQERPGMFNCQSASDILTFVEGYAAAVGEHGLADKDLAHFDGFTGFVKKQYNDASGHANWAMLLQFHSANNQEAFSNFFKSFNQYIAG